MRSKKAVVLLSAMFLVIISIIVMEISDRDTIVNCGDNEILIQDISRATIYRIETLSSMAEKKNILNRNEIVDILRTVENAIEDSSQEENCAIQYGAGITVLTVYLQGRNEPILIKMIDGGSQFAKQKHYTLTLEGTNYVVSEDLLLELWNGLKYDIAQCPFSEVPI